MRLTKTIRENIIESLLTLKFKPKFDAFEERRKELADALYEEHIKPPVSDPEWVLVDQDIYVEHPDFQNRWYGGPSSAENTKCMLTSLRLKMTVSRPMPIRSRYGNERYTPSPNLAKRFSRLAASIEKTVDEYEKVDTDLTDLLNSVRTYNQLKEAWPEGKEYYDKYFPKGTTTAIVNPTLALRMTAAFTAPL